MKRFRGGLVFKSHIILYHSTLGLIVIKKKKIGRESAYHAAAARLIRAEVNRLTDFVYRSTLGLRVIKKKQKKKPGFRFKV